MTEDQKRVLTDALAEGRFDEALAIFVDNVRADIPDPKPGIFRTPGGRAMATDEQKYRFHIRPHNRIAIALTRPGWAAATGNDYWYVSIYDRVPGGPGGWEFRSVYPGGGVTYGKAIEIAGIWYDRESEA